MIVLRLDIEHLPLILDKLLKSYKRCRCMSKLSLTYSLLRKDGEKEKTHLWCSCKQAWGLRNRAAMYTLFYLPPRKLGSRDGLTSLSSNQSKTLSVLTINAMITEPKKEVEDWMVTAD